jgi:alpha-glucosidase
MAIFRAWATVLAALVASHAGLAANSPAAPAALKTLIARDDGAEIQSGPTRLRVTAITEDVLRVRVAPAGEFSEDASWVVPAEVRHRTVHVSAVSTGGSSAMEFRTASLDVRMEANPLRLTVSDLAGHVISADAPVRAIAIEGNEFTLRKVLPASEHYFGLGDKAGPLDHRGQAFANWNTDAFGFQESTDPLYKSIPFFVAVGGEGGSYGIFLDNTWRSWFDFGPSGAGVRIRRGSDRLLRGLWTEHASRG